MAIGNPTRRTFNGFVWSIRGKPYTRKTVIEVLYQGRWGNALRRNPDVLRRGMANLQKALVQRAPVDTGMLKKSITLVRTGRKPHIEIGPPPYNRQKLKAQQAGRVYKQRKRGRVKLAKYYALPANQRSRRQQYIELSIRSIAARMERELKREERQRRSGIRQGRLFD